MGGLAIGIVLVFVPQVMSVGYEHVDQALQGSLALRTLVLLCAVKLVATVVSYASGNAGGIFAPTLFLGAMAGGAVGIGMQTWAPFPTGGPGAYALVGMGALFAGIIRAPMTSVFMIFELTQDYQILVPLMVANLFSFLISKRYQAKPIYHALLEQDDVHLPGPASRVGATAWRARDLMVPRPPFIPPESTVAEAWMGVEGGGAVCHLVGSPESLVGLVRRRDLEEGIGAGRGAEPVTSLLVPGNVHVHADHPLEIVLERFRASPGILPVLSRGDVDRVEGVITKAEILRFVEHAP